MSTSYFKIIPYLALLFLGYLNHVFYMQRLWNCLLPQGQALRTILMCWFFRPTRWLTVVQGYLLWDQLGSSIRWKWPRHGHSNSCRRLQVVTLNSKDKSETACSHAYQTRCLLWSSLTCVLYGLSPGQVSYELSVHSSVEQLKHVPM